MNEDIWALAVFFFARSFKSGHWLKSGEKVKCQVFDEEGLTRGTHDGNTETKPQRIC
jgi:hypothetical protein